MSISKENPNKNDFEELYQNKNPWNFDGTLNDLIRLKILNNIFQDTYFQRGLDVACGEGFLTTRINFVENKFGVDISEKAIHRAKMSYKNVTFESGDAFKNYTTDSKFDFISCF
jgi:predicted TPR repeat methyltransferase